MYPSGVAVALGITNIPLQLEVDFICLLQKIKQDKIIQKGVEDIRNRDVKNRDIELDKLLSGKGRF